MFEPQLMAAINNGDSRECYSILFSKSRRTEPMSNALRQFGTKEKVSGNNFRELITKIQALHTELMSLIMEFTEQAQSVALIADAVLTRLSAPVHALALQAASPHQIKDQPGKAPCEILFQNLIKALNGDHPVIDLNYVQQALASTSTYERRTSRFESKDASKTKTASDGSKKTLYCKFHPQAASHTTADCKFKPKQDAPTKTDHKDAPKSTEAAQTNVARTERGEPSGRGGAHANRGGFTQRGGHRGGRGGNAASVKRVTVADPSRAEGEFAAGEAT